MIVRTLKLRPNKVQEAQLNQWLWNLTGLWNWAIKKIENDARDGVYYSPFDFVNLVANHSMGRFKDKLQRFVRRFVLCGRKIMAGHRPSCWFVADPTSTTDCFCRRWHKPNSAICDKSA